MRIGAFHISYRFVCYNVIMKITKHGHCCLSIETEKGTVLTDPGTYTNAQDSLTGIDIVLITHEHADHLHTDSIKRVLTNNPKAEVVCNSAVGTLLDEAGIMYTVLEGVDDKEIQGINIVARDCLHAEIFDEIGLVQNTGYLIDGKVYIPGDSFAIPDIRIEILALPVAGPWCKIPDALRYCIAVKPKKAFPVHDAMLKDSSLSFLHGMTEKILASKEITFVPMVAGDTREF